MLPLRNPVLRENLSGRIQEVTFMILKVLKEVIDGRKINFSNELIHNWEKMAFMYILILYEKIYI